MFMVKFQEEHSGATGTFQRIITKRRKNRSTPLVEGKKNLMFIARNGSSYFGVRWTVSGIDTVVTDHFKVFFRDMLNQPRNKIQDRKSFDDKEIVFVTIIMKSDKIVVIIIDSGSSNDRTSKIATDVFDYRGRITFVWFGINVKAIFML